MTVKFDVVLLQRALLVGLAFYAGAWLGVTQTITLEGIAILWPPNGVLLSAFLLFPYRQWPWLGIAALLAECLADVPAFPLWAALGFGLINLFEAALAAWLIRRAMGGRFDFDRLKSGACFLLYGPLLASALAALAGAAIYLLLDRADSGYWALWRVWWFGDALGLLLLTPLIVVMWHWLEKGLPRINWPAVGELLVLWSLLIVSGLMIFPEGVRGEPGFHLTAIILLPFSAWAAVRFGVRGAAMTVVIIAVLAVGFIVRGIHPYADYAPQLAVWLVQEYLAVVAVFSIGLAILLEEIRSQRNRLEQRVSERTRELEEANLRLKEQASMDFLTGIANRRHFHHTAQRELKRRTVIGGAVSLILFDVDHFKQVNDRFGHDAGDMVLNRVVDLVKEMIRPLDMFGRFGGEEFLILLPDTPQDIAVKVAERIRKALEALKISYDDQTIAVTVSLGVAQWDGHSSLDELITQADKALYEAKTLGHNQVQAATPAPDADQAQRGAGEA